MERVLANLKDNISTAVKFYPLFFALASFVIFIGTLNVAHLFMSISLLFVLPIIVVLLNSLLSKFLPTDWISISAAKQCFLNATKVAGDGPVSMAPSYWMTAAAFIATYLIWNAADLYSKPAPENSPPEKAMARKSQSLLAIVLVAVVTVILIVARFRSQCESWGGGVVGLAVGVGLAAATYNFMVDCAGNRNADLFGIANRLIEVRDSGVACYPVT